MPNSLRCKIKKFHHQGKLSDTEMNRVLTALDAVEGHKQTFSEWLEENKEPGNILPPGMDAQVAIQFLIDYLLDDFVLCYPASVLQVNTEAVSAILEKYSKKYKAELKELDNT